MNRPSGKAARRRSGRSPQCAVIAVFTEGKITEPHYVAELNREFRDRIKLTVRSEGAGRDPLTLVRHAVRYKRSLRRGRAASADEVWCLFDRDDHESFDEALEIAWQNSIGVAASVPCFEIWLWWHHADQSAEIERHVLCDRCESAGLIKDKRLGDAAIILEREAAARRARSNDAMHQRNDRPDHSNPSSSMPLFLDAITSRLR